ncbi:YhgE/Pip family protein [Mesobacillus maritimus]|uniref:YhgE/Pip family protein n=1 Tax=Mesobacillus maritimus TaxID=1643336 RepID=UPI003850B51C
MKNSLFVAEWKQIFSNRKVLIPILAVICVPILYAGMFLWAFWDPYAQLEDLPVAVINQDQGAEFEGEQLELGDRLVDNLKENDSFQFHFVSKEQGYQDLENQKYYIVIEIPEDFSEHATTLLDNEPQKLSLKYVPNESHNFLSAQIGETAVNEIKSVISKEVTATYAETIFDKVTEMADGFRQASDGAGELHNGAGKLAEGANTLTENLEILASKSIEFNEGIGKVQSGSGEVATGLDELSTGVNQLSQGSNQLLAASKELQSGSAQLISGLAETEAGMSELDTKLPALVAGTSQVQSGLIEFQEELPGQLAASIGEQLGTSVNQMNAGLDQLETQLSSQLSAGIAEQIASQQTAQMTQMFEALRKANIDQNTLQAIQQQLAESTPSQADLEKQLKVGISQGLNQGFTQYKTTVSEQLDGSTSQLEAQIQTAVAPTFTELINGLKTINENQVKLQDGVHLLAEGSSQLSGGASKLAAGQNEYVRNLAQFDEKLASATAGANKLATGAGELNTGMAQLADGSSKISDGTNQLADGSKALVDGTLQVEGGTKELKDKLGDAAGQAGSVKADDQTYDMMGEPVTVENEAINEVPNYGTGFAPYFLSLGLFVGALLISIVYQMKMPSVRPRTGFAWFLGKFGVFAVIGTIQAIIADIILLFGLGMEVQSVPLFILTSMVISFTFMALVQFFVTLFGDPGRFMAILILIFQLTTSAGTFPLELIPKALQPINALLPMTYSVQALKAVVSSGNFAYMWHNIAILIAFMAGFATLTSIYFSIQHKSKRDLVPEQNVAD